MKLIPLMWTQDQEAENQSGSIFLSKGSWEQRGAHVFVLESRWHSSWNTEISLQSYLVSFYFLNWNFILTYNLNYKTFRNCLSVNLLSSYFPWLQDQLIFHQNVARNLVILDSPWHHEPPRGISLNVGYGHHQNVECGHHEKHHLMSKCVTETITSVATQERLKCLSRLHGVRYETYYSSHCQGCKPCDAAIFSCLGYTIF